MSQTGRSVVSVRRQNTYLTKLHTSQWSTSRSPFLYYLAIKYINSVFQMYGANLLIRSLGKYYSFWLGRMFSLGVICLIPLVANSNTTSFLQALLSKITFEFMLTPTASPCRHVASQCLCAHPVPIPTLSLSSWLVSLNCVDSN